MTLPTFLVIGAMKAGTTSLHSYLDAHPQVFMASPKELHFFVEGKNWELGRQWYEDRFAGATDELALGEASPSYTQADIFPGVPERIASLVPEVQLVYVVRHPVERIRSMYLHQIANRRERRPIEEALREDEMYLNASRYAWQLEQYLRHFPPDRIHVLFSEDLRDRREATLGALYRFLGVDPTVPDGVEAERGATEEKRVRTSTGTWLQRRVPYRRLVGVLPSGVRARARRAVTRPIDRDMADIPAELDAELRERLAPDVERLVELVGDDRPRRWGIAGA